MPFKIRLKKSRQYNVTSKSLFVISVYHLLDTSTAVDCTLSSASKGRECLENVCLRLSINQPEYFGLRYIVKGTDDEYKWVDLDRPLSRQFEKYAAKTLLFLRIMFYVSPAVALINDEVTRYYFYLQLKSDVVDGRINCDPKQVIILASYCRQAEYDTYQREKHTLEYLKSLLPIPKHMIDMGLLETLAEEVLHESHQFQNITQSQAEEHFILTCQQIQGFGEEKFIAVNKNGNEVTLGATFLGISVLDDTYVFYPWRDITNIIHHKKNVNIDCTDPAKSIAFTFSDTEIAHYMWKTTVAQHTMHTKCEIKINSQKNTIYRNHLITESQIINNSDTYQNQNKSTSFSELQPSSQYLWSDLNYHSTSEQSINASNLTLANNSGNQNHINHDYQYDPTLFENVVASNQYLNWTNILNNNQNGSNTSLNNRQVQSSSCLDLSNNNIYQESESKKSLLPLYRPAPDYETAVQQKYRASSSELRLSTPMIHVANDHIVSDQHLNVFRYESQNEINKLGITHHLRQPHRYPDVTQTTNSMYTQGHYGVDSVGQPFKLMRITKPPPPYPVSRISSTSTPDLALASQRALFGYRGIYVSGSSPDLVSTRNFGRHNLNFHQKSNPILFTAPHPALENTRLGHSQSYLPPHGTFEHLNIIDHPNYLQQQKQLHQSQEIHKVYDGNKVIYCVPRAVENIFIQDIPPSALQENFHQIISPNSANTSQQQINELIEPIYENVPFSWPNDNNNLNVDMRDRTSSVQSAPGIMRNVEKIVKPKPPIVNEEQIQMNFSSNSISQDKPSPTSSSSSRDNHNILKNKNRNFISSNSNLGQYNSTSSDLMLNRINPTNNIEETANEMKLTKTVETDIKKLNNSNTSSTMDSSKSSIFSTATLNNSNEIKTEKPKKRWAGLLSRAKLGGSKNSDKQKSATLGREKGHKSKFNVYDQDENNLKYRWSTGLTKSQSLPTDISKEKLCQLLEARLADEKLFIEFEQVPKRKENARFDCALNDENKTMNFDPDFLPYDDNRVKLTPTRENRLGYVNASHVTATVGSKQRFYIVAQSPRNTLTCNIFWKCVWEADVYLIIQLSDDLKYIPKNGERHLDYGQYQVWREFSQESERCVTSKLRLYHTQNRRYRSVWHLSYLEWGDQNCPKSVVHFLDFLEELNSVRLASIAEVPPGHNTNPPVLIHCGGGGGRAGVTLASDLLLYTLDHNQALNIPEVVKKLCEQRDKIIPSLAQYKFIYALLIHYLKRNRLI